MAEKSAVTPQNFCKCIDFYKRMCYNKITMKTIQDFSKATNVKKYFAELLIELANVKVKGIYSRLPFFSTNPYICKTDEPIYILLDNGKCIVIDYHFIDNLEIEYREMTEEELEVYRDAPTADYFNCVHKVHNAHTMQITEVDKVDLQYGKIVDVKLKPVKVEYNKWVEGHLIVVQPDKETFSEMEFVMDNGASFIVCADDAESDGYSLLWSNDASVEIEEF